MKSTRVLRAASGFVISAAVLAVLSLGVRAAEPSGPLPLLLELPAGPAKAGFDLARFSPAAHGQFETFHVHVDDTQPLREALATGHVAEDTPVLVTEVGREMVVLLMEQMAYHHIAQGKTAGTEWLVTFCVVCNTGTRLAPSIDGVRHTFRTVGVYDGVMVMQDVETKSLWNHITGEALYGPLVGRTLGPPSNALHMNVRQALAMNRQARIAISDRVYVAGGRELGFLRGFGPGTGSLTAPARVRLAMRRAQLGGTSATPQPAPTPIAPNPDFALNPMFIATLGAEDGRRPRMDLGLGLWTGTTRRFYPMEVLRGNGNAVIDTFDGRTLLVYIDPGTYTPAAVFVDSRQARVENKQILLDDRQYVENGMLFGSNGKRLKEERPQQLFTRWYGFALTFPDTEVFGPE